MDRALDFALPPHLQGLENTVIEKAERHERHIGTEGFDFAQETRSIALEFDRRIRSYIALAKVATNPNSLPFKLKGATEPEPWDPFA